MANRRTIIMALAAGLIVLGGTSWFVLAHRHAQPVSAPVTHPSSAQARSKPSVSEGGPTTAPLSMPVAGKVMTDFGWQYSGALNEWYYNPGITIAAKQGAAVRAAWSGTVAYVGQQPHMGLTVTVKDGDGFETVYGHLGSAAVKVGDAVKQGQPIGTVGGSSLYSRQSGSHVDFQLFHGATATNPLNYLHPSS
jgi:murein DD-endopeptidase MepM/ murein hydrolase activator NlpD